MIDEDYKFFRENFSASSFSGEATPHESKHTSYQSKIPKVSVKGDSKIITASQKESTQGKEGGGSVGQAQKSSRAEGKLGSNWVETQKEVQLKVLQKLKTEHKGIRHFNSQEGLPQPRYQEEKLESSRNIISSSRRLEPHSNPIQSTHSNPNPKPTPSLLPSPPTPSIELLSLKQSLLATTTQLTQLKHLHQTQVSNYQQKISLLTEQSRSKQTQIKHLRKNQADLQEKYTNQVREFQSQLQDSNETIANLRREILEKQSENEELRQRNRTYQSSTESYQLEQELAIARSREKGYLETIERLERQNGSDYYPGISTYVNNRDSSSEVVGEIERLRATLGEREEKWNQRLAETIEKERKLHLVELQKLITIRQGPISFGSEERIEPTGSRNEIVPILDRIVTEIQQLKKAKSETSSITVTQQLRGIKQFISKLQKTQKEAQNQSSQGQTPNVTQLLKVQLSNYKKFILEEEKSKRAFLEQLNLYRTQNLEIINENTYLRHQLGTIQHHMNNESPDNSKYMEEIHSLKVEIQEQNEKIEQYELQVSELHDQLVNSQPQRPMILNRSSDQQLHNEIQRLHQIIQAQSQYFIKVNTEITRYFQSQINLYQQRIRVYEQSITATHSFIQENETRLHKLSARPLGDPNSVIKSNQMFQQEAVEFRNELGGLITTNRQIQSQIREQSESVDQIWRAKQEELHGEMLVIERLKSQQ